MIEQPIGREGIGDLVEPTGTTTKTIMNPFQLQLRRILMNARGNNFIGGSLTGTAFPAIQRLLAAWNGLALERDTPLVFTV